MAEYNSFTPSSDKVGKRTLVNILEVLVPDIYLKEDRGLSTSEQEIEVDLINSHINIAVNLSQLFTINSTQEFPNLDSIDGLQKFFVKQNGYSYVTPKIFEEKVLLLDSKSFKDFNDKEEFEIYLEDVLLPKIILNEAYVGFQSYAHMTPEQRLELHNYLIQYLGWVYFMNNSGHSGDTIAPSSVILNSLSDLYQGVDITLNVALKDLTEYLWNNYNNLQALDLESLLPENYLSGSNQYTSGTQQLDKLKTMVDVVYSPAFIDREDFKVRDLFEDYRQTLELTFELVHNGPFRRLLKAFSYSMADVDNQIDQLSILYDINDCPDDYLPYLADLIGWKLFGYDPNRWRLQLYNAVSVYKRAGTKQSIEFAINSVFTEGVVDLSGNIFELWESYIPNLIFYALATEAPSLSSFDSWTKDKSISMGVDIYSHKSMEDNWRILVDTILYELALEYPNNFVLGNEKFPVGEEDFVFNYRGRDFPIPPWEEVPYYTQSTLSEDFLLALADKMVCFGVNQDFALSTINYIADNTIRANDDIREGNGWLLFTSSIQHAPNWEEIIGSPILNKETYLSLWNGKSSHYKLLFDATDFNFSKDTLEVDSKNVVTLTSRIAEEFAPAHAIQDTRVRITDEDFYTIYNVFFPYVDLSRKDLAATNMSDPTTSDPTDNSEITRWGLSAVDMRPGAETTFSATRDEMNSIKDSLISSTDAVTEPRNAFRRRDHKYNLTLEGFYRRTGFDGPTTFDPSVLQYDYTNDDQAETEIRSIEGYLPLGWVPSSMSFVSLGTEGWKDLPTIYSKCENLNSSNSYSGVDVSSTFPCRGLSPLGANNKYRT